MKLVVYEEIVSEIQRDKRRHCLKNLQNKFPSIPVMTLKSIYSNEYQRRMKRNHPRCNTESSSSALYCEYQKRVSCGEKPGILLRMADQVDLSPCLLARVVLEKFLSCSTADCQNTSRQNTTQMLRDSTKIPDRVLAVEIFMCTIQDDNYSPLTECIKHHIGEEHEDLLKSKVKAIGIPFLDENNLRERGYDKTPDVKLEIPIAVDGKVVNWIESKALFGDPVVHQKYLTDQYWSYWNRFGPGLVIYWLGFVDELDVNREKGILIKAKFPENIIFMDTSS